MGLISCRCGGQHSASETHDGAVRRLERARALAACNGVHDVAADLNRTICDMQSRYYPHAELDEEQRETDRNGVEFGSNCLTPGVCRGNNLCLGTCKLF